MSKNSLSLGKSGEDLAADFLRQNDYRIIKRNHKNKLGEIDIIASDRGVICFIEVKTRNSERFGLPQEAVVKRKQRQISKAALLYLKDNNLLDKSARFDVVSVISCGEIPKIELIKNAFELTPNFTC